MFNFRCEASMKIVFLHGLEGSPNGAKSRWLNKYYDAHVPVLDTSRAKHHLQTLGRDPSFQLSSEDLGDMMRLPTRAAVAALKLGADLLIGSSFGAAVLGCLVEQGIWSGPCIFLAGAHVKLSTVGCFRGTSLCIHGRLDTIIDPEPVRAFVDKCGPPHEFWMVEDDHRLRSILADGTLTRAIEKLTVDK